MIISLSAPVARPGSPKISGGVPRRVEPRAPSTLAVRQWERLGPTIAVEARHPIFPVAFLRRREIIISRILPRADNGGANFRRHPHVGPGCEHVRLRDAIAGE